MSPLQPTPLHGDEDELFRSHHDRLARAVRAVVIADDDIVEDACSFAWLQLVQHQPRRDTVYPWLKRVAIRAAWHFAERERRDIHFDLFDENNDARIGPCDTERAHEAREALATLAALPERQRRYLTLFVTGLSYDEIAALTGTSLSAVNKQLVKARSTIRRRHA